MGLLGSGFSLEAPDVDLSTLGQIPGLEGGTHVGVLLHRESTRHPDFGDF